MKPFTWTRTLMAAGGVIAVATFGSLAMAQTPPTPPTFTYLYGLALLGGENLSPENQPVVAFVNGQSCGGGTAQTFVATEGENVPDGDVGRTVYVIDVLADGTKTYERAGCGHPGDPILLYFPMSGRMASTQPLFQAGPLRADVDLGVALPHRAVIPQVASDGPN